MRRGTVIGVVVGFLFGTAGVPILKTKTLKKGYTYAAAGAMIARDKVMEIVEEVQAESVNVTEDAKVIVKKYYAEKEEQADTVIDDDFSEA